MSRRSQRISGTVMTLMPVFAEAALMMSFSEVNITRLDLTSPLGKGKSRPLSAPRVTWR
ncbi:hypothetical protein ABIF76_002746 [Bradyrhizobium ottawaense]